MSSAPYLTDAALTDLRDAISDVQVLAQSPEGREALAANWAALKVAQARIADLAAIFQPRAA